MSVSKKEWVVELFWDDRTFKGQDECLHAKAWDWVAIWETTLIRDKLKPGQRDDMGWAIPNAKDTHMEPDTIENCVRYAMELGKRYVSWELRLKHVPSGDIVPIEAL